MSESVNEFLVGAYIARGVYLARADATMQNEVARMLNELSKELVKTLSTVNLQRGEIFVKLKRLERIRKNVEELASSHYELIQKRIRKNVKLLLDSELKWMGRTINQYIGVDLVSATLNKTLLQSLAGNVMILGAPSSSWWKRQEFTTSFNFMKEMRIGIILGEDLGDLVRRVRGRRENNYRDGVMATSTRETEALVRTSAQTVLSDARFMVYEKNKDILSGVQWHTALDYKVCIRCRPRDGAVWDIKGNPLNEIAKKNAFRNPPIHYNDRCILIPVLKSWEDLASIYGGNTKLGRALDDMSESTRSSVNGQVPDTLTFEEWIKIEDRKSPGKVEKMMTPGKYKSWKEDKLSLEDFLDDRGNPLKLSELKNL